MRSLLPSMFSDSGELTKAPGQKSLFSGKWTSRYPILSEATPNSRNRNKTAKIPASPSMITPLGQGSKPSQSLLLQETLVLDLLRVQVRPHILQDHEPFCVPFLSRILRRQYTPCSQSLSTVGLPIRQRFISATGAGICMSRIPLNTNIIRCTVRVLSTFTPFNCFHDVTICCYIFGRLTGRRPKVGSQ